MGTPAFAEAVLAELINGGYNIIGAATQPDKKSGRKQELRKSPVKILAEKNNIPVFTPEKLDAEAVLQMKNLNPDIIIVAAYGKIIPKSILEIPKFKALNVHPSLLPKYRGASPIQNALLNGESGTGTTIMLMDEGMDTGDILSQEKIPVGNEETCETLSKRLAEKSSELLLKTIPLWLNGKIIPQKQNSAEATYCKILKREDGKIDWQDSAQNIYNRYRAFSPWPGIFSFWNRNGKSYRIKLNKISLENTPVNSDLPAGKIVEIENGIAVKTGSGFIILEKIQLGGKKSAALKEFINGYPDFIGSALE